MKPNMFFIPLFALLMILFSCESDNERRGVGKVEIKKVKGKYALYKDGKEYFIKGAVGSLECLSEVKKSGGNSIRTYGGENIQAILDSAYKYDLSVIVGVYMGPLRHGFNYADQRAVKQQYENIKQQVISLKDHPAILMWAIGNELNLQPDGKPHDSSELWNAVDDIAEMIHEVDPDHPVTTMIVPYTKSIAKIKWYCPNLDLLSFNVFGPLHQLDSKVSIPLIGWSKPYLISEWGGLGWWESKKTLWSAPIEDNSTRKGKVYKEKYVSSILNTPPKCLGSYVFYWGKKQERTDTWFSMIDEEGNISEAVHVMRSFWNNGIMDNQSPQIHYVTLNGKLNKKNVFVEPGSLNEAFVSVSDPENDTLEIKWEIKPESITEGFWGEHEEEPEPVFVIKEKEMARLQFIAPDAGKAYRLFCYIYDGKGNYATANFPFYVVKE